jgi:phage anti-repressor protein
LDLKVIADEMLPIYETSHGEKVVNARELHEKLLINTRFNDWVSRQIDNYGFVEKEDFYSFLSKTPGRPSQEYIFTLDTAKEIAMVQNNEMGRAIRKYFIAIEKRYQQKQPKTQAEMMLMYAQQMVENEKRVAALEHSNQTLKHRVDNLDKIDVNGDAQQRLNKMIKRYAWDNRLQIDKAWKQFDQAFNTAYRTNITAKRNNCMVKHGFKKLSRPQYLSITNQLEDAIRVADKMLNRLSETNLNSIVNHYQVQ